ncbi:hypothetical protein GE09DRAFT_1046994 [Coniochaeta sp. 2T2.1]|nr:hypothetical protein GE09DRAFT_1046994 [Coniochaeta sp. 2T2.1]
MAALRIASISGAVTDRRHGFADVAKSEDVSFIVGDWLSEYNMTARGGSKAKSPDSTEFEPTFLEAVVPALPYLEQRGIKVAVNAGASDTEKLYETLTGIIEEQGRELNVAWIEGDEVLDVVKDALRSGDKFESLTTGEDFQTWGHEPIYAQCYLGCWGIVEAFRQGADIVLCGRVADASPTMACAAYHYGWARNDYPRLAHALVAGHLIECSTYVTGGNFSGFKSLLGCVDMGFPVAEVESSGEFVVTMQSGKDGMVTVETCKAQLLYEIQGPYYYNSDVVAILDGIKMVQAGHNRVHVSNIGSTRPPATTKVGITALGGYQAEAHYYICGLDVEEKAAMVERQIRHLLDESRYHCLKFRVHGRCPDNPSNQAAATVDLRIFAQARDESALSPSSFVRPIYDTIMQSYPGATFAIDARQALPRVYYEYWVSVMPQSLVRHVCHPYGISIKPPQDTVDFSYSQPSYETRNPVVTPSPCTRAPLGYVVHARSGDKGSDSNVGFFVRHEDEWDWLRSVLTVQKVRELLGEEDSGKPIFRFELEHIWAVHFLLKDHLDRGVSSSSTYDTLGKNVAEYLRCRHVDIPNRFLERGRI